MNQTDAARIIEAEMRASQKDNELCPGEMLNKVRAHWMNEHHRQALAIQIEMVHVEAHREAAWRRLGETSNVREMRPARERA